MPPLKVYARVRDESGGAADAFTASRQAADRYYDAGAAVATKESYLKELMVEGIKGWVKDGQVGAFDRADAPFAPPLDGLPLDQTVLSDHESTRIDSGDFDDTEEFKLLKVVMDGVVTTVDLFVGRLAECSGSNSHWRERWRLVLVYKGTYTAVYWVKVRGTGRILLHARPFIINLTSRAYVYKRPMPNWRTVCDELDKINKMKDENPVPPSAESPYRFMEGTEFIPDPPPPPPPDDEKRRILKDEEDFSWTVDSGDLPGHGGGRVLVRQGTFSAQPQASELTSGYLTSVPAPITYLISATATPVLQDGHGGDSSTLSPPLRSASPGFILDRQIDVSRLATVDWHVTADSVTQTADVDPDGVQIRPRPRTRFLQ